MVKLKRIKEVLNKKAYKSFEKFMRGQTMSFDKNGDTIVYDDDFIRFIYKLPVVD